LFFFIPVSGLKEQLPMGYAIPLTDRREQGRYMMALKGPAGKGHTATSVQIPLVKLSYMSYSDKEGTASPVEVVQMYDPIRNECK
jgi:hypothetical protein